MGHRLRDVRRIALLAALAAAAPAGAAGPDETAAGMANAIERGHALLEPPPGGAAIAIIIDDLGNQHAAGLRAIALPGAVALSFLPGTPFARAQAELAYARGKEVLLHLPLEPLSSARAYPTAITAATGKAELLAHVESALAAVPHARGVNNHQGSRLTEMAEPMDWLMGDLKTHPGLYFVDSRTTAASVAFRAALAHRVPAAERQVFLDNTRGEASVRRAFRELLARARQSERALAIGHPYPETLKVLEQELPHLRDAGVVLITPSALIAWQAGGPPPVKLRISPTLTLATGATGPAAPAAMSAGAR